MVSIQLLPTKSVKKKKKKWTQWYEVFPFFNRNFKNDTLYELSNIKMLPTTLGKPNKIYLLESGPQLPACSLSSAPLRGIGSKYREKIAQNRANVTTTRKNKVIEFLFSATTKDVRLYSEKQSNISCDSFSNYSPVGTCHFIWHILKILSYDNNYYIKFWVDTVTQTLHSSLTHFIRNTWLQSGQNTAERIELQP